MATPDYVIKQGDIGRTITATLRDQVGPVDLTGATVRFHLTPVSGGSVAVDALGDLVTPAAGTVAYDWQAADTAVAGLYYAEWEIAFPNGATATFPSDSYLLVRVLEQLA